MPPRRWDDPSRLREVVVDVELLERYLSRRAARGAAFEVVGSIPRILHLDELTPAQKEEWAILLRDEAARDRREWGEAS